MSLIDQEFYYQSLELPFESLGERVPSPSLIMQTFEQPLPTMGAVKITELDAEQLDQLRTLGGEVVDTMSARWVEMFMNETAGHATVLGEEPEADSSTQLAMFEATTEGVEEPVAFETQAQATIRQMLEADDDVTETAEAMWRMFGAGKVSVAAYRTLAGTAELVVDDFIEDLRMLKGIIFQWRDQGEAYHAANAAVLQGMSAAYRQPHQLAMSEAEVVFVPELETV